MKAQIIKSGSGIRAIKAGLSAVIFVVIIPLIWITKPSKDGAKAAAGAGGH